MKNIPAWAKRPTLFLLGLALVEPIRWAVGSALDETYEAFGWRWARLGAAMSEAITPITYLTIALGLVGALIWSWRQAFRTEPAPQAPTLSQQPAHSSASLGANSEPIKGTSPAYRKAVLQVTSVNSERQATSGKVITSATCRMNVTNAVLQPLEACSIVITSLTRGKEVLAKGETMRPGEFDLPRSQSRSFILAHRDRTDLISNPPHILRTMQADHALKDGADYEVTLELRSAYPHPTIVVIGLSVPEDPDGAVIGKIISQDVDRR